MQPVLLLVLIAASAIAAPLPPPDAEPNGDDPVPWIFGQPYITLRPNSSPTPPLSRPAGTGTPVPPAPMSTPAVGTVRPASTRAAAAFEIDLGNLGTLPSPTPVRATVTPTRVTIHPTESPPSSSIAGFNVDIDLGNLGTLLATPRTMTRIPAGNTGVQSTAVRNTGVQSTAVRATSTATPTEFPPSSSTAGLNVDIDLATPRTMTRIPAGNTGVQSTAVRNTGVTVRATETPTPTPVDATVATLTIVSRSPLPTATPTDTSTVPRIQITGIATLVKLP
ncbi:hypothetical protein HDU96_005522 [Phlyctochytrium bullatum]|nr:hypothetical protein HDU96_005522 [Phlyctochytrium bullatum]